MSVGTPARAATISNTATLDVKLGGAPYSVASNTVTADTVPAPTPAVVQFLRPLPVIEGLRASIGEATFKIVTNGAQCRDTTGTFTSLPGAKGEQATEADGGLTVLPTDAYRAGETVYLSLTDGNRNRDPEARETVDLKLVTSGDDEEALRLMETAPNSGMFAVAIPSVSIPPVVEKFDCQLSLGSGTEIRVSYTDVFYPTDLAEASVLVDPFGLLFDSVTGALLDGVEVTLLDEQTGRPARVFGDDGISAYPSTVTSGGGTTDASGASYAFPRGGFRFPLVAPGRYRLSIAAPEGYTVPSRAPPEQLAALRDADGQPYVIDPDGSFLGAFVVNGPIPFRLDVPFDPRLSSLVLEKSASVTEASLGDFVQYRLTLQNQNPALAADAFVIDTLPEGIRYRSGSLRVDGRRLTDPVPSADGRTLRIAAGAVAAQGSVEVTYIAQVTAGARAGQAVNRAVAQAQGLPASSEARAAVRIKPPLFTDAATVIGRIAEGGCDVDPKAAVGVAGIRLVMEDGTFVVSDQDGLFHFEGVRPGVHVVQIDLNTLPADLEPVACVRSTRNGGRAFSQFIDVRGGALWRTDFFLRRKAGAAAPTTEAAPPAPVTAAIDDATAAGGRTDWLAGQTPGNEWLFPAVDYNPRSPTVRAAVKHEAGTTVKLTVNGEPADPLAFDGTTESGDKAVLVSVWNGLPIEEGDNRLVAEVVGRDGAVIARLERIAHYANAVARAALVPEKSRLIADGVGKPVIAVRLTDRHGKPVRHGVTGTFRLSAPYQAAQAVEAQQQRQLAGLDGAEPTYRITGDDGIAYIELAPTSATGAVELTFTHQSERRRVVEELRAWLQHGNQPFVLIGFAAGTAGFDTLARNGDKLEDTGRDESFKDGQVSLFAKGRVLGKWLMTLAYDTDKHRGRDERRFGGTIDPQRYYTIYADGSEQGYDAASTKKLYLRLERPQFYALFGDYETGLTQTQLARYSRSFTGVKTEYAGERVSLTAFAAETPFRFARDEIQGSGLSGLYRLSRHDIVLNSDKIRIETRDRFRSELIVDSRVLTRHIDYDIDYVAATLRFRQPVPSRDRDLNPVFIVAEYETEGAASKQTSAGGRVGTAFADGRVEFGASLIHDETDAATTDLGGVDVKVRAGANTEVRLEAAQSRADSDLGETRGEAYLAEVEHRSGRFDALAYFRQQDADFGVGQLNRAEAGTRKYGADARYHLTDDVSLTGTAWRQEALVGRARRNAAEALAEYRHEGTDLRAGFQLASDKVESGETLTSQLVTLGARRAFLDNKLVLDAETALALSGKDESLDFPNRYRVGASYAVSPDVRLIGTHEITDGEKADTSTTSLGFDASPWKGARLNTTLNQQGIRENGSRAFALYGLNQGFVLNERWSLDASIDGSRTLDGAIRADEVVNPNHPVSSGGFIGAGDTLSDDFWAVSTGATYRAEDWSWNGRAEYRNGDLDRRVGFTTAMLHQTNAGISYAASGQFYRTEQTGGATATLAVLDGSIAYRPLGSRWAVLDKLEFRIDALKNGQGANRGLLGANGLSVTGDAVSRRIINNLALNLVSRDEQRTQLSLYYGSKYAFDRYDDLDLGGYTDVIGVEVRHDLTPHVDVGLDGSIRHAWSANNLAYSIGPSIGVSPVKNVWISLGYNVAGYEDRDFEESRYTSKGPFVTLRFKFDQDTPAELYRRVARR